MDEAHLECPCTASWMMHGLLRQDGFSVGRVRMVARLMKRMVSAANYRLPQSVKPGPGQKIYPFGNTVYLFKQTEPACLLKHNLETKPRQGHAQASALPSTALWSHHRQVFFDDWQFVRRHNFSPVFNIRQLQRISKNDTKSPPWRLNFGLPDTV